MNDFWTEYDKRINAYHQAKKRSQRKCIIGHIIVYSLLGFFAFLSSPTIENIDMLLGMPFAGLLFGAFVSILN